jgi:hypothetical protein
MLWILAIVLESPMSVQPSEKVWLQLAALGILGPTVPGRAADYARAPRWRGIHEPVRLRASRVRDHPRIDRLQIDTRGFASVWRAVADESGVSDRREVVTRSAPVGRFEPSWGQSLSVSLRDARPGREGVVSAWPLVDENRVPCGLRSCGAGYAVRSAARRLSCRAGHRWPAPIETGRTGEPE